MATRKSPTRERSTLPPAARPDEAILGLATALRDTMRTIAGESRDEKLFPFGITKISLGINLPAGISATLDIEGPSTRSGSSRTGLTDTTAVTPFAGRSIDSLNLAPHALAGAQSLSHQFGDDIVFTSGRRSVSDQCRVMAQNIVTTGNRHWIGDTYKQGQELQAWVDAHPDATSVDDLQAGLQSVMSGWDDAKLKTISYHLSGAAFDIVPVAGARGDEIKTAIGNLSFENKFIDGESGVKVWHTQFDE